MARALTAQVEAVIAAAIDTFNMPDATHDGHSGLRTAAIAPRIVIAHFLMRQAASQRNDSTDGVSLFLHGNKIAWWKHRAVNPSVSAWDLHVSDAGWPTPTTRSRLRLLPGVEGIAGRKNRELYGHAVRGGLWWNGADWICYTRYHAGKNPLTSCATPDDARVTACRLPQPERKGVDCRDGTSEKRGWQSRA